MNNNDPLFMGKDNFCWFFGKVEDIADPLGLGRCKIRVTGWHNPDDSILPTSGLPWAYPITSINNPAIAGIGQPPIGPQINTRVFGFFADGKTAQQPIIIGTLQGETLKETFKKLPYGCPPQQPIMNKLFGFTVLGRESNCISGNDLNNSSIEQQIPDPRNISICDNEWKLPTTGFVSSSYGERSGRHNGVDICPAGFYQQINPGSHHLYNKLRGPTGQPITAAAAGKVIYLWGNDKGQKGVYSEYDKTGKGSRSFGNAIAIKHSLSTGNFITIYAHLGENQDPSLDTTNSGINVSLGESVFAGQIIGTMGRTHNRDTLTHLHFEIRIGDSLPKANNHINPGWIFPQLKTKHWSWISWANIPMLYSTIIPFKPVDAPVISGEGPKI